jgi:predicted metalloendopeptidase
MAKGINLEYLDTTTAPETDFYQFVNGGWMDRIEIPGDRSSWGSFYELAKQTDEKVLSILSQELSTPGSSPNKAARLYETGMDTPGIEKFKLRAIQPWLEEVRKLTSVEDLPGFAAKLTSIGIPVFLAQSVHPDLAKSNVYALYLEPAPTGLPERDYYLDEDQKAIEIRTRYQSYIALILQEGAAYTEEQANHAARSILDMETAISQHQLSKEDRRQIDKIYNPLTVEQLKTTYGGWNWNSYFDLTQNIDNQIIILTDPVYFQYFTSAVNHLPLETIKSYITYTLIHVSAPFAHAALEKAHFDFFSKTLEGVQVMKPRNERVVKIVNNRLGELLGQLFVEKHFPPEAKATALEMTSDIIEAYRNRITSLEWMSEETKAFALQKLSSFRVKIGYPDSWKDFSALTITGPDEGGHYLQNLIHISAWKQKQDLERAGKEVDREEWFMAPQIVNAYYNPLFNEIVFPAAILQPPFFDWEADAAVNYGGIGAVIGHEITHGFDDQGSRFNQHGNYNEWWTDHDRKSFDAITRKLVDQFDAYFPFEDLSLNGTFTLGENIADLGGLCVAYDALQLYYQRHGRPGPIDGFTADQRFFMSWATVWRTKTRPEALRNQIKTDPHPPGLYRAVAAPSNMDNFYQAFGISPQSKWYRSPEDRIKIW